MQYATANLKQILPNIIDATPTALIIINHEGTIEFANIAAEKLFGYSRQEFFQLKLEKLVPEDFQDRHAQLRSQFYEHPETRAMGAGRDLYSLTKDGRQIPVEIGLNPIETEAGNYVIASIVDITERKLLEHKISEERFGTLVSNIPGAVYRCANDPLWTMFFISNAIETISGYPATDFIGNKVRSLFSIIHPEDQAFVTDTVQHALTHNSTYSMEYRIIHRDGKVRCVFEKGKGLYSEVSKLLWLDGVIFDVTSEKVTQEKLQESEAKLRMAQNLAALGSWEYNLDTGATSWSDEMFKIHGLVVRPEPPSFEEISALIYPPDRDAWRTMIQSLLRRESMERGEFRIIRPDGDIRWLLAHLNVHRNQSGKIIRHYGTIMDITEQKRSETELLKMMTAVEQSPASVVITNTKGDIEYVNPKFTEVTGYGIKEAIGKNPRILKSGEKTALDYKDLWDTITSGKTWHGEFHNRKKNGELYWEQASISPIRDAKGEIRNYIAVKTDITEQKGLQQRQQLQYSISRVLIESDNFETAFNSILTVICNFLKWDWGAIWLLDSSKSVLQCNCIWRDQKNNTDILDNAAKNSTLPRGIGFPGMLWFEEKPLWIVDAQNDPRLPLAPFIEKIGFHSLMGFPIKIGGNFIGAIELFSKKILRHDKKLLETLEIVGGQIGQYFVRRQAEEKIQEAAQAKSDFTSIVSHELRTPLMIIKGSVDVIYDGIVGEINAEQKDLLSSTKRNIDRLARLINDVLDLQKLEAGRMEFDIKEQNLCPILENIVQDFASIVQNKGLKLTLELNSCSRVNCDRDKITQVVINLLNNAIKFTEQGEIKIITEALEKSLKVSVIDSGPGIKKEDLERLFQSFSQVGKVSERKTGGTGLGLSISKKIIERHGGEIGVISTQGEGSTFYFTLPFIRI